MNKIRMFEAKKDAERSDSTAYIEESLVTDTRACLTPCQMVERKLVKLLNNQPLPVSFQTANRRILRRT